MLVVRPNYKSVVLIHIARNKNKFLEFLTLTQITLFTPLPSKELLVKYVCM